jgi:hypothetical protein
MSIAVLRFDCLAGDPDLAKKGLPKTLNCAMQVGALLSKPYPTTIVLGLDREDAYYAIRPLSGILFTRRSRDYRQGGPRFS